MLGTMSYGQGYLGASVEDVFELLEMNEGMTLDALIGREDGADFLLGFEGYRYYLYLDETEEYIKSSVLVPAETWVVEAMLEETNDGNWIKGDERNWYKYGEYFTVRLHLYVNPQNKLPLFEFMLNYE